MKSITSLASEDEIEQEQWKFAAESNGRTIAVVSIILSIDGLFDFDAYDSWKGVLDWEKALNEIATIAKANKRLRNATILWTPNSDEEVLSPRKLFFEYPDLEQEYLRHQPIQTKKQERTVNLWFDSDGDYWDNNWFDDDFDDNNRDNEDDLDD